MAAIVFNQYMPGGTFKQLSDAAGIVGWPYSQYAPGGPPEQLRVAIDPTLVLDQHAAGGPIQQAAVRVSSGGSSYTAKAVHFDGMTWLINLGLAATDSPLITISGWIKAVITGVGHQLPIFDFDPPSVEFGPNLGPNQMTVTQYWSDAAGNSWMSATSAANSWRDNQWHHIFMYANTGLSAHNKTAKIFIDGVDVASGGLTDTYPAFNIWFNGVSVAFPDTTDDYPMPFLTGDVADWWVGCGVHETDITIFRNPSTGKPNDPASFPPGTILFSGDATSFATNKGTGGAFTLTGTLSNATTSPSDLSKVSS